MLAPEQIDLLVWLNNQVRPVSQNEMQTLNAPGYTWNRIEKMRETGLIDRNIHGDFHGHTYGVYTISDQGKAALLEAQQMADQQAKEKAQQEESLELQRKQTRISEKSYRATVVQVIISLLSFILGLLVEHYTGLVDLFSGLAG